MVHRLILASASPARLTTLRNAGVQPDVIVSGVDEDAALAASGPLAPTEVPLVLARAKAEAVAAVEGAESGTGTNVEGAVVLGCDSVLELDGQVFGKPADAAQARARWREMRGNSGALHTGHWLIDRRTGRSAAVGETASTTVHFADISDAEIEAYVATGEPLQVAGAFTVDGLGGPYVRSIEGDYHTVVGLSLPLLRELLGRLGIAWHDLREDA